MDNMSESSPVQVTIRASIGSYMFFAGPWILVATTIFDYLHRPRADAINAFLVCLVGALLQGAWLRGFKLTVTDELLEYRDGFYKVSKISLANLSEMKSKWVKTFAYPYYPHTVPRTAVITKDRKTAFLINFNPFGVKNYRMIRDLLEKAKQA